MIPKNWEGSDFYGDLGVDPSASAAEIKAAYRKLVREFHPDVNKSADRGERFRQITAAYTVLSDEKSRDLYDDYALGYQDIPRRRAEPKKKQRKVLGLFGRVALFMILLLLLRNFGFIAPQQVAQTNSATGQTSTSTTNTTSKPANGNSNQVLALMVGPQGPPGPAGVAGENGFIGMNGYQGKDGLPGAPGPVGEQGPIGPTGLQGVQGIQGIQGIQGLQGDGVVVVALSSGDANCSEGGTKFIASNGTVSYACNGSGGSGGGGSGTLGTGYVNVGACDSSVKISLDTAFTGSEFKMSAIIIDELAGACNGLTLTAVLKIKSGSIDGAGAGTYQAGDVYSCSTRLSLDPTSGSNANSLALTSDDCTNTRTNANTFTSVYAIDVSSDSRGLQIQIS